MKSSRESLPPVLIAPQHSQAFHHAVSFLTASITAEFSYSQPPLRNGFGHSMLLTDFAASCAAVQ